MCVEHFRFGKQLCRFGLRIHVVWISAAIYRKFDSWQRDKGFWRGMWHKCICVSTTHLHNVCVCVCECIVYASFFHFRNVILDAKMISMFLSVMKKYTSRRKKEQHCQEHIHTENKKIKENCYEYESQRLHGLYCQRFSHYYKLTQLSFPSIQGYIHRISFKPSRNTEGCQPTNKPMMQSHRFHVMDGLDDSCSIANHVYCVDALTLWWFLIIIIVELF